MSFTVEIRGFSVKQCHLCSEYRRLTVVACRRFGAPGRREADTPLVCMYVCMYVCMTM